ncbi:MAG: FAD-dependent oxidoreductase [Candidatus Hydrogenedentes bacterium]|nr:FAD-dependent oxidoreductase [Candidatus Hydrogenedentota bacterium]
MSTLGSAERPLRVAIVGSGPSGFYSTEALFKSDLSIHVDMFDRLPTPFGLVRGGVAPDHPKIKSVTKIYDKIAAHDGFTFFGNVTVGRDISVEELRQFYDAILFACGAETDNRLGVPGEDLPGSHTATEFVGWYNGHPDYRDREFDLSREVAVVIGQGNVAMDVSRILAKTADELRHTDIAEYALDALAESKVREIHLIGRRGPAQAKFTTPELREIGELAECDVIVRHEDLAVDAASQAELDDTENHTARKNMAELRAIAERTTAGKKRRYVMHFLKSPVELVGAARVESIRLEHNRLEGKPFQTRAAGTGTFEELACGLVFRSVGYRGVPVPGVPFDAARGLIPNAAGRVLDGASAVSGLYVAGWIKRGPSGVIGTNKPDSQETVASLIADSATLAPCAIPDTGALRGLLGQRGIRSVSYADWKRIDAAEIERGQAKGKPREKFARIGEMLEVF